jgi:hypothetical protein
MYTYRKMYLRVIVVAILGCFQLPMKAQNQKFREIKNIYGERILKRNSLYSNTYTFGRLVDRSDSVVYKFDSLLNLHVGLEHDYNDSSSVSYILYILTENGRDSISYFKLKLKTTVPELVSLNMTNERITLWVGRDKKFNFSNSSTLLNELKIFAEMSSISVKEY